MRIEGQVIFLAAHGRHDPYVVGRPLVEKGRLQAEWLGGQVARYAIGHSKPVDGVFSSKARWAVTFAQFLASRVWVDDVGRTNILGDIHGDLPEATVPEIINIYLEKIIEESLLTVLVTHPEHANSILKAIVGREQAERDQIETVCEGCAYKIVRGELIDSVEYIKNKG